MVWEWDLNARSDDDKRSTRGRMETKQQKQCKDYMKPLFKLCKKNKVPGNIAHGLFEVFFPCLSLFSPVKYEIR